MKTLALLLALCSGCLVLPKTKTTTKDLGTETGEIEQGAITKLALRAELADGTVEITATADRTCERRVYRVIETRKEKHASYRPNQDARAGVIALLLAPVTIPVSALGTGIAVLADGDGDATTAYSDAGRERFACTTVAAKTPIEVKLPSGATLTEVTDAEGRARVQIPETEPYQGVVAITSGTTTTELRYARAMPAITAVRETVMTCSALHHVSGKLTVELGIDDNGYPVRIGVDAGDGLFAQCMNEALAKTRFGKVHRGNKLVLPFELPG